MENLSPNKYAVRHLIPDNLIQAKQNMLNQLKAFKEANAVSTRERVSSKGFIFQKEKNSSKLAVEKIVSSK